MVDLMLDYAFQFIGLPYRWGGDDPIHGFDCSGFVQECLSSVGMDPPGDQTAQALHDHFVGTSASNVPLPGSLAFFGKDVSRITHVALILDSKSMIEAGGGGSKTVSLEAAASQNAFIRVRPINSRRDLVALLFPPYPGGM